MSRNTPQETRVNRYKGTDHGPQSTRATNRPLNQRQHHGPQEKSPMPYNAIDGKFQNKTSLELLQVGQGLPGERVLTAKGQDGTFWVDGGVVLIRMAVAHVSKYANFILKTDAYQCR